MRLILLARFEPLSAKYREMGGNRPQKIFHPRCQMPSARCVVLLHRRHPRDARTGRNTRKLTDSLQPFDQCVTKSLDGRAIDLG